ncbi:BLUF domain-containing protein [Mucilaginibacter robiniae]|uniref:BLUF domain-containing protein n=1 Tax=Mucilaginibacter robiniae TaxID=2728022 RepID=A0A7L5DTV6_9SPHI|nr:BLUF domain-containing protein [Mucilaginibacter robiniae]QJD94545.1 BLUF domain-containing protein [Mucilaginibacter robiniae]
MPFYLIYTSKAAKLMQESDLLNILLESRKSNLEHDLTGMLLYIEGQFSSQQSGRFIQVLEGEKADVIKIYEKIAQDSRHYNVILLNESEIDKRNFTTWSMGFESLTLDKFKQISGYFELNDNFLKKINVQKFNMPLTMLKSFYELHLEAKANKE